MRKFFIFFGAFILIIINIKCKKEENKSAEGKINTFKSCFYPEPFEFFTSDMYNKDNFYGTLNPSSLYVEGYSIVYFKKILDIKEFNLFILKLESQNIFKSNMLDSTNYYIPNFKKDNIHDKFPIPNLNDSFFSIKKTIHPETSVIFGLKREEGKFFNKKGIKEANYFPDINKYSPIGKGYSNGVIIDKQSRIVFYWILVW